MQKDMALAEQVARLVEAGNDSHIAARSLGINEATHAEWLEDWPEYREMLLQADAKFQVQLNKRLSVRDLDAQHRRWGRQRYFERLKALSLGQEAA